MTGIASQGARPPKTGASAVICGKPTATPGSAVAAFQATTPATSRPIRASPAIRPEAVRMPAFSTRAFCAAL